MQQLFLQKGKIFIKETPMPACGLKSILVRVMYSFVSSGTEGATVANSAQPLATRFISNVTQNTKKVLDTFHEHGAAVTWSLIKNKSGMIMPLGYSCSGQIIEVGAEVSSFRVGDYVACAGSGIANHAQVVAVPQNLAVRIVDQSYIKQASITTIGAIALQGIRRAGLQLGEKVCVVGLGLLGQLTVQLAKQAGCFVIGIDIQETRMQLAKQLGADLVFNAATDNVAHDISIATAHMGVDVTLITAASSQGALLQQAMLMTRRKGRVVLVGDVKIDFDRDPFYSKEIDFLISCSYGPGRYDDTYEKDGRDYPYAYVRWTEKRNMELFAQMVQQGALNIDALISHEYLLDEAPAAYDSLAQGTSMGLVISYPSEEIIQPGLEKKETSGGIFQPYKPVAAEIKVACIGVGGFSKVKLLPLLARIPFVSIASVIDMDPANAYNVARQYDVISVDNNYHQLLQQHDIHAAVVATPHGMHAEQSINLMRAGKAVFVEKPAAVSFEQYYQLAAFLKEHQHDVCYCVDFNRSYAPFFRMIKKITSQRINPMVIQYRMNAGYIPQDHWIHAEHNRGRIIGEACHIFELFCFLTDSSPETITVHTPMMRGNDYASSDNFIATLHMRDGSLCTLTYTALGDGRMGKERAEIFVDGKSLVMDDFTRLSGFGVPSSYNQTVKQADRGHASIMQAFFDAVAGKAPLPISYDRILQATHISLIVDQLARKGGGWERY